MQPNFEEPARNVEIEDQIAPNNRIHNHSVGKVDNNYGSNRNDASGIANHVHLKYDNI